MDNRKLILTDVATFVLLGLVAALFGFSTVGGTQVLIGRVIFFISMILAALSLVVKRPPPRIR